MAAVAGRRFEREIRAGLGDVTPTGRVRLDALARLAQDLAFADVDDAGTAEEALWVVRRAEVAVARFPRFNEPLAGRTWCSGLGSLWAERTTTLGDGVSIVAVWVHLDLSSGRPIPFSEREIAVYGASAGGRRVRARLQHPGPPPGAERSPWAFRAAELDLAGHVNNAAYWTPLEEELLEAAAEPARVRAEIEYRTPAQPGPHEVLRAGARRWIAAPSGDVHASVVLETA